MPHGASEVEPETSREAGRGATVSVGVALSNQRPSACGRFAWHPASAVTACVTAWWQGSKRGGPLTTIHHRVVLDSEAASGAAVAPAALAMLVGRFNACLRGAVSTAFRGTSRIKSPAPHWLAAASDVRLAGRDATVLHFEAPTFGTAAPELYEQREPWPTRPDPSHTSFEVLARVLGDVNREHRDSDRYDPSLLRRLHDFGRLLNDMFRAARIEHFSSGGSEYARLDAATAERAGRLGSEAPRPQRALVVGVLDTLRERTKSFVIRVDSGEEVCGLLVRRAELAALFGRRVAAEGRAVFRPSGHLLCLEAELVAPGEGTSEIFSRVPKSLARPHDSSQWSKPQGPTTGVNAFFGRWPGDESEEELLDQLDALS